MSDVGSPKNEVNIKKTSKKELRNVTKVWKLWEVKSIVWTEGTQQIAEGTVSRLVGSDVLKWNETKRC